MCIEFKAFCCSIGAGLLTMVLLIIIMYFVNKYRFNNGVCRKYGGNPRYLDYRYPIFNKNSGKIEGYYEISKK